ncbi:hypothetical protein G3N57_09205 [Paraburkholderia sp. Se-20369]|nr:hypothetical protein [Paraburkholderia sp. Se-20369]
MREVKAAEIIRVSGGKGVPVMLPIPDGDIDPGFSSVTPVRPLPFPWPGCGVGSRPGSAFPIGVIPPGWLR